jgi:uncharacterized BrkB/YihY/UPF0761 family membrane protein
MAFLSTTWSLLKETGSNFIADRALSRGASIAYYTLFSLAPVVWRSAARRRRAPSSTS